MPSLEQSEKVLRNFLHSYETGSYEDFTDLSVGKLREVPRSTFFRVQEKLAAALACGFKLDYLTELRQYNQQVFTWKLSFTNGRGDVVLFLSLTTEGKASGFLLQGV